MSQDLRFRFSRRIAPTDITSQRMVKYIDQLAVGQAKRQSDLLFELICARYLPLASQEPQSADNQLQAMRSIYLLESSIKEILLACGMEDPRYGGASTTLFPDSARNAPSVEPEPLQSIDLDEEPDVEDGVPDSGPDKSTQSTINRMRL